MIETILTQDFLKKVFEYKEGILYWKIQKTNAIKIGNPAGNKHKDGYRTIMLNGKNYLAHRLIFLYHHGFMPKEIDHIDNNRGNDKIEKLRQCTRAGNQQNITAQKNNTSGIKGVSWHKKAKKWQAHICVYKERKYLGLFKDINEAQEAYLKEKERIDYEFRT